MPIVEGKEPTRDDIKRGRVVKYGTGVFPVGTSDTFTRAERWETVMLRKKQGPNPKRKVVPVLGAAGLSLSLVGGASAAGAQVADGPTHKAVVSHEITLGEEEIADVSLATFYVFDKENAGPSRHSERLACGCWTGTYYTSGNDAYPTPLRPVTPHGHVPKHIPK